VTAQIALQGQGKGTGRKMGEGRERKGRREDAEEEWGSPPDDSVSA